MNNKLPKWRAIQTYTSTLDLKVRTRVIVYDDYETAKKDCEEWMGLMCDFNKNYEQDRNLGYQLHSNADINVQLEGLNDPIIDHIEVTGRVGNNGSVSLFESPAVITSEYRDFDDRTKKWYLTTRSRKFSQNEINEATKCKIPLVVIDYLTGKVYHNLDKTR